MRDIIENWKKLGLKNLGYLLSSYQRVKEDPVPWCLSIDGLVKN
jgi:hypothetical protein